MTALNIIEDAMQEIGTLAAGETASGEDAAFGLSRLNDLIDSWAAQNLFVWAKAFVGGGYLGAKTPTYTLTPNHQPHTIGPAASTPDFVIPSLLSQRPVKVSNANIVLTGTTPQVEQPLNIRDHDWWSNQRVKSILATLPTDLYYEPDFPNGSLYFWPIPQVAYRLDIELWSSLGQIPTLPTVISVPPGYREALKLTLAESLAAPFGAQLSPMTVQRAMKARLVIQGPNSGAPRIVTNDYGIPNARKSGSRSDFNWLTGSVG